MEGILTNTQEFIVPIIVWACLLIGYVIKHTPYLDKVANAYIPLIVTVLGAILGVATSGLSIESVIYGAVSGLASTGLHQAFTRVLGLDKEGGGISMTENANPENIVDEITSIRNRLKEIDTKLKERQLRGTKTAFYIQNALFFTDDACYAAKEETLE